MSLPRHVIKAVEEIAADEKITNISLEHSLGSNKGDNYIGDIRRITIKGIKDEEEVKMSLICKMAPDHVIRREKYQVVRCFERERYAYTEILPEFTEMQKKFGISDTEKFISDVKCYNIMTEDMKETFIFEDLKERGYVMWERAKPLDYQHAALIMQELGKLHAISFALRDQQPEVFKKMADIKDIYFNDFEYMKEVVPYFHIFLDKATQSLDDSEVEARNKMADFKDRFSEIMYEGVSGTSAEPYAVLCHGDCWTNNMLFKYKGGTPVSMILIDWQIMRYSSPVTDLNYAIFCCTDRALRDEHYGRLLEHYHNSLSNFLEKLGSDAQKLFPFSALQDQLTRFSGFVLGMAVHDIPHSLSRPEDVHDVDKMAELLENGELHADYFDSLNEDTGTVYKQRMSDVIRDYIRLKYL